MKLVFVILLFSFNLFSSDKISPEQKPKMMLESISQHAIKIGTGTSKEVYIFVDPMCQYSRKIITKILDNKMLQVVNTYYIFFYALEKYPSDNLIEYIFESENQLESLEEVMVYESMLELEEYEAKDKTTRALKEVAKVGKNLKITLRPYIISFEKGSKYCQVSEGELSCVEDF